MTLVYVLLAIFVFGVIYLKFIKKPKEQTTPDPIIDPIPTPDPVEPVYVSIMFKDKEGFGASIYWTDKNGTAQIRTIDANKKFGPVCALKDSWGGAFVVESENC